VRDTGGGIPEAIRDRIFDPYFTTKPAGTGIGLYLSRQIAQRTFGGRLDARNVEEGAEFCLLAPLPPETPAP
jgi:signal transduction histidine kinase